MTTMDEEVTLIWRYARERRMALLIYVLNRYTNMLQYVIQSVTVNSLTKLVSTTSVRFVDRLSHPLHRSGKLLLVLFFVSTVSFVL